MARQFYQPIQATLCDICEGDDCDPSLCKEEAQTAGQATGNPSAASSLSLLQPALLAAVAALALTVGR